VYWTTFDAVSARPDTNAPATKHDIANHWRSTKSSRQERGTAGAKNEQQT